MELNSTGAIPATSPPRKTWVDRIQALFEVVLLTGWVSGLLAALPFTWNSAGRTSLLADLRTLSGFLLLEAFITFLLLYLVMRAHGESLQWLGLCWRRWRADALIGCAIVPILFGINAVANVIIRFYFPRFLLERNPLTELVRTPQDLGIFIGTALIAGGIKEELQRAFILRRFQADLGGASLGLILWSIVFAIGHYVQGAQGIVVAGSFGVILGIAYLVRGTLIAPIVAHGVYDTVALLGYWFTKSHS
jgi:membrane protease YdiL (CAAX protease family)